MQYNKIKFTVGVFVITLFVLILSSLYFLLEEKGLFDKRYNYYFDISSAQSFSVGMPLKFSGFNIGVVDEIALKDDGSVKIRFSVNEENRKWISRGTVLKIIKPLIGSPYIEVDSQLGKSALKPGSTLKILQSDDINDMIAKMEPVVRKIIKIIDSIETITAYLASGDSELIKILRNLDSFSEKLAQDDSLLTSLTGDESSTKLFIDSLAELNKSMKEITRISKNLGEVSDSLDEKLIEPTSNSIHNLDEIMKDIRKRLEVIDGTVNSVGSYDKDLVEVREQISIAIAKSNQIIEKVDGLMRESEESEVVLP